MAIIYVFNDNDGGIEKYTRAPSDPMPYNIGGTLKVSEFMGTNAVGWTDTNTMNAWNTFRSFYGKPVQVSYAYLKVSQELAPLVKTVQHFAGTAFAVGGDLTAQGRQELYDDAVESDAFSVVQTYDGVAPHVYFDSRYLPSDYFVTFGLPVCSRGRKGNYCQTIQDILIASGYNPGEADGIFGQNTEAAVRKFQSDRLLTDSGIVGLIEWNSLFNYDGVVV
ncbi:MAG: peptidoglycan-binding domain-containing protein [Oscillospiraceae bacterium]